MEHIKRSDNQRISAGIYFICATVYYELLFHILRVGVLNIDLFYKLLFSVVNGFLIVILLSLLPKVVPHILLNILMGVFTVYFVIQFMYKGIFDSYFSFSGTFEVMEQAFDYWDVIWQEFLREWWQILLFILPLIVYIVLCILGILGFAHFKWQQYILFTGIAMLCFAGNIMILFLEEDKPDSFYNVLTKYSSVDVAVEKIGVWKSFLLDVKTGVFLTFDINQSAHDFIPENQSQETITSDVISTESPSDSDDYSENTSEEPAETEEEEPEVVIDNSPNIWDIDFDTLIANETNPSIRNLHEYIRTVQPTNKNEYTGMFEGYNLIFVVAEGFDGYVIDKELTPTLYQMSTEGFVFPNYYTPLWYGSTIGGEYADLTGLMPKNGAYISMKKMAKNKNDMPFTMGISLKRLGYEVLAYHNNSYTYYDRHISRPVLGYRWTAIRQGLEAETDVSGREIWPQSDLSMIQNTTQEYMNSEPFYTYYLTVSGHLVYSFSGNAMSRRHADIVADLDYSDTTKAYIACQYELELAMESLIENLTEAGIADHTLIVITSDHIPYNDKAIVDELAGKTLDNTFEWYKNTLIIWSASMEEPIYSDKYCSSLDVLPTISNLMGVSYDSRMLVGQDIMSDSEGIVYFNDRSFLTDRCSYNANTKEVISFDGSEIEQEYIEAKITQVNNKFQMAESICENDYYRSIDTYVAE